MRWQAPDRFKAERWTGVVAAHVCALAIMLAIFAGAVAATSVLRVAVWLIVFRH